MNGTDDPEHARRDPIQLERENERLRRELDDCRVALRESRKAHLEELSALRARHRELTARFDALRSADRPGFVDGIRALVERPTTDALPGLGDEGPGIRKIRKFRRDPLGFLADSKNPWVRRIGRAAKPSRR